MQGWRWSWACSKVLALAALSQARAACAKLAAAKGAAMSLCSNKTDKLL
jgi:hypothetical protein